MKWLNNKWIKLILSGTMLILIYKLFNNFSDVADVFNKIIDILFPIILGAAIAFFLSRPAEKIAQLVSKIKYPPVKKKALGIGVIVLYTLIFFLLFLLVKFVSPRIYKNIEEFAKNIPVYYETFKSFIEQSDILSKLEGFEFNLTKLAEIFNLSNINKYIGFISGIANSFLTFFLSIILSVYMIIEKRNIIGFLKRAMERFLPEKTGKVLLIYGKKTVERVYSYFTGLSIDALLVALVSSLFFSLFKVPYAFLLGFIVGIGNLVPFFGPITANIIIFIITAITTGPFKALWIIVFQFIFGQIDGNIIQPKILSNSTGISPLLVLIAVIVFGDLFGFVGMIVGVPVFAVIKDIVTDYVDDGKLNDSI